MLATTLGEAQGASRLRLTSLSGLSICYLSTSILFLNVQIGCSADVSSISHPTLVRRHSTMSTNMADPPASGICKKGKPILSPSEAIQGRLHLLNTLIGTTEGRTDLSSKQMARRKRHISEKAGLELKLAGLRLPIALEPLNGPVPISTLATVLGSDNSIPPQSSQSSTAINQPADKLPARPSFALRQRTLQQSPSHPNSGMLVPFGSAPSKRKEQRAKPSAASGGVPEPSKIYMSISEMEPQAATTPQHLLLVIDLNGTLLYRPRKNSPHSFIERPSAQQFLDYALAHHSIMIWSSAQPKNVERMCHKLFSKDSREKLIAIWARDRLGLSEADSQKRVQVYKRLERVWNDTDIQARHPLVNEGKRWHQGNTVLVDDSVEKSRSEPYNFIEVVEFTGKKEDPNMLQELSEYLAALSMQTNVSSYIHRHPFKNLKENAMPNATTVQPLSAQCCGNSS